MYVARSVPVEHKDLIHDVAFDYHGRRMATCSSDQSVKIWDLAENGSDWVCTASWKTHSGSVWRVTWAHPEFGQVIATCSFDRTAAVWEEIGTNPKGGKASSDQGHQKHWIKRSVLVDSRTSVTDVKFAPKHLGLQLATCSVDGVVRMYEAPDVMNLSGWTVQHEIQNKLSCSCLSWNTSRVHPPMLAIGSNDPSPTSGAKVHLYEYNDPLRKWTKTDTIARVTEAVNDVAFAPNLGRSYHLLAVAAKDVKIFMIKPRRPDSSQQSSSSIEVLATFDEHNSQVWRLSWNVTGTILASSGDDGSVRLWKANYMGNWKSLSVMKGDGTTPQSATQQAPFTPQGGPGVPHYKMGPVIKPSQAPMLH